MDYSRLEILLILITGYTLIRFISLKKQLRKIEKQVYFKERINISLNDKDIEKLAETINNNMRENKQIEIDIMKREERLKQNISDIAHDLRTPLSSIMGYITLLDNCTEKEKKEYINIIQRKSEELNLLINNFYEVSLLDNSSLKIDITSIDIVQVIMDIVISNYALIKNNKIEINNRVPEKQIKIYGEEITCKRIIQNLVSNSIKYSTGYISIELDELENEVVFTIKNNVSNLKESDIEHLFERFYTVDKSRNRSGSGLGLYIVKLLLNKIGGEVKVAQSMGEKNIKEVKSYIKSSIELNVFLSLTYSLILILFNKQLIRIFINDEATTVIAANYLSAVAFSQIFSAIEMISNGMFTGIGKPKIPATISIIFTSFRIPLAILLIKPFGISGIWISICVSSILKGISSYLIYEVKIKRNL